MKATIPKNPLTNPQPFVPKLLTKKEAARLLGMCVRNIELLINKKALAVVRCGQRCVRFKPEDLDHYIESRRIRAIGETASR